MVNSNPTVEILMATYNGESYLKQQLDSFFDQTFRDWFISVRDDGSSDGTLEILRKANVSNPGMMHVSKGRCLKTLGNFEFLLQQAKADYMLFSDQDDVWMPTKIDSLFNVMKTLEKEYGQQTPLLVHSDATVVDHNLSHIHKSLWQYQNTNPITGSSLCRLLVQNTITGCTMMINRALRDAALPFPPEAMMHDWWLALVASALGKIGIVPEATVLYRQHENNQIGAGVGGLTSLMDRLRHGRKVEETIRCLQAQAGALLRMHKDALSPSQIEMLTIYSKLHTFGFFRRRYYRIRYGFLYEGFVKNVGRILAG